MSADPCDCGASAKWSTIHGLRVCVPRGCIYPGDLWMVE